jgi:hypothetical protein
VSPLSRGRVGVCPLPDPVQEGGNTFGDAMCNPGPGDVVEP